MKRALLLVILGLFVVGLCLLQAGCGGNASDKHDTPAGHPDELKDSTRFDPAADTTKGEQPRETPE
jgi:hypothetical protein